MWGDFVDVRFQSSTAVLLRIQFFLNVILYRSFGVLDVSKHLQTTETLSDHTEPHVSVNPSLPTLATHCKAIFQAFFGKPKKYEKNVIQSNGP
jgi:hypothetical protein